MLTILERLGGAGAGFHGVTEAIDTTMPAGRMMMQMVGAFAEFEWAMLRERSRAGLVTWGEKTAAGAAGPGELLCRRRAVLVVPGPR